MSTPINGSDETLVNTTTFSDQSAPAIARLAGGFVIAWQSQQAPEDYFNPHFAPGSDLCMQRYDATGNAIGGETHVNTVAINDQVQPCIAATADGGFTVAWASAREQGMTAFDKGIYFQHFDAQGNAVGAETQANSFYNLDQERPAIAALENGDGFVVTWWSDVQSGNPPGLFMRRFGADGSALTPETRVGTGTAGPQSDAAVAALPTGFVLAWDAAGGVFSQRFDNDGTALAPATQVNAMAANGLAQPAIAALHDGGYVVAWQAQDSDGTGIHMQRFGADGAPAGGESVVNSEAAGEQVQPALTALDDGGFALAWTSGGDIVSQRFDAAGHAVGGQAPVDAVAGGQASDASLSSDGHNGFVATWASNGQDGSGSGVYAMDIPAAPAGSPQAVPGNGGSDVDVAVVHASVLDVTSYSIDGSVLTISTTSTGTLQFSNVERVKFDDAFFALDTQAPSASSEGGHAWQAEALLWAALGFAPDVSLLSQWTAAADQAPDMSTLAQEFLDYYAPGVSSADLVTHLYAKIAHTTAPAEVLASVDEQVGPGLTFENNGELLAYAATLAMNTENFADIAGSPVPLDASWFGL